MGKKEEKWAEALLEQAREDFVAAEILFREGRPIQAPSVFVMLIQMVIEKMTKAACLRKGLITLEYKRHKIAVKFLPILIRLPRDSGIKVFNWHGIQNIINEIEAALPTREDDHPQLEYPWEDSRGEILYPARDLPVVKRMKDPGCQDGPILIKFARWLLKNFDSIVK